MIGATTENPSFEINSALCSPAAKSLCCKRCQTRRPGARCSATRLTIAKSGFGGQKIQVDARAALHDRHVCQWRCPDGPEYVGDGGAQRRTDHYRGGNAGHTGDRGTVPFSKKSLLYDKNGEEHYNLDLCPAQIHAQQRCKRRHLLAGPYAGGGGRPFVCSPPPDPVCQRRHRHGRQPGPGDRRGRSTRHAISSACPNAM